MFFQRLQFQFTNLNNSIHLLHHYEIQKAHFRLYQSKRRRKTIFETDDTEKKDEADFF